MTGPVNARAPSRAGLFVAIVLLTAILIVLLLNLIPLVAEARIVPDERRSINRGVTSYVGLADAAHRARERAQAWAGDAELVRAEAAWYIAPGWESVDSPPVAWVFNYYSSASSSLASVVIDDDNLLWVPAFEIPVVPAALAAFPPAQGVDVAWLSFLAAGGETFLYAHSDAQVSFRLQQKAAGPSWTVTAYGGDELMQVVLNAQTGVVALSDVERPE